MLHETWETVVGARTSRETLQRWKEKRQGLLAGNKRKLPAHEIERRGRPRKRCAVDVLRNSQDTTAPSLGSAQISSPDWTTRIPLVGDYLLPSEGEHIWPARSEAHQATPHRLEVPHSLQNNAEQLGPHGEYILSEYTASSTLPLNPEQGDRELLAFYGMPLEGTASSTLPDQGDPGQRAFYDEDIPEQRAFYGEGTSEYSASSTLPLNPEQGDRELLAFYGMPLEGTASSTLPDQGDPGQRAFYCIPPEYTASFTLPPEQLASHVGSAIALSGISTDPAFSRLSRILSQRA